MRGGGSELYNTKKRKLGPSPQSRPAPPPFCVSPYCAGATASCYLTALTGRNGAAAQPPSFPRAGGRILVVEDNAMNQKARLLLYSASDKITGEIYQMVSINMVI